MIGTKDLQQKLSKQFNLQCFVDLAELTLTPSRVYQLFQQCHQPAFDSMDRLVFYTSHQISDRLLKHLYEASALIDISNFFVLICSPNNIAQQLTSAVELYSTDQICFQSLQIELEPTQPLQDNFFVPDTLCPLPWMHLEVSNLGTVKPCCVYETPVADIRHTKLQDIFRGQHLSDLRKDFLSGHRPNGCRNCWNLEDKGLTSDRTYHIKFYKKDLMTKLLDLPTIKSLDLKPGNTCNFKCRICNSYSSSLFAQEVSKIKNIPAVKIDWPDDPKTIDEVLEYSSSLINIDLYGGEPFLIKPLTRLVEQIVNKGHAGNINLHYNSNGSIYPEHLTDYWSHFQHVDIQFSIDNIGQRFELERGGQWSQIDENIKKLIDLQMPNVSISVMPTISIMNVLYLDELLSWAHSLGLTVNPLYVSKPQGFDLKNLTQDAKKLIAQKLQNQTWPELKNILSYIQSVPGSDGSEFVKLCRYFDNIRNQDFCQSHPEIAAAMGYTKHPV